MVLVLLTVAGLVCLHEHKKNKRLQKKINNTPGPSAPASYQPYPNYPPQAPYNDRDMDLMDRSPPYNATAPQDYAPPYTYQAAKSEKTPPVYPGEHPASRDERLYGTARPEKRQGQGPW